MDTSVGNIAQAEVSRLDVYSAGGEAPSDGSREFDREHNGGAVLPAADLSLARFSQACVGTRLSDREPTEV